MLRRRRDAPAASFLAPAGDLVAGAALILIVWLLSASSGAEALQAAVAVIIGVVLFVAFARRG